MSSSGVEQSVVLLLAASALHAGFQLTVTLVVYPALVRAEPFAPAHERHTRGITPVVVLVYGVLLVACVLRLLAGSYDVGAVVALGGAAVAAGATALVAAPTHGRLGALVESDRTGRERLGRRLLVADRVRAGAAVVGLAGAVGAAGSSLPLLS